MSMVIYARAPVKNSLLLLFTLAWWRWALTRCLIAAELKDRAAKVADRSGQSSGLMELMEKEQRQVRQKRRALGILMMDLDNF